MSEEELEIKLEDIIEDLLEHYHEYHNDIDHVDDGSSSAHSKIMSLIHSYTQEKCREARLDELSNFKPDDGGDFTYYLVLDEVTSVNERITELQAQLNKSKGEK